MRGVRVEWISQEDAAERLGLSVRRVLEYATAGRIRARQQGKAAREMHAGDVERVAGEREGKRQAAHVRALATVEPEVRAVTRLQETRALLASSAPAAAPQWRLWLTLAEAEEYSGLPAELLAAMVEAGSLPAFDVGIRRGVRGRWRVRRADLEALEGERRPRA